MPAAEPGDTERLFGLVRLLAIGVTWSRFAGAAVPVYADVPGQLLLDAVFWGASVLAFLGVRTRPMLLLTGLACFGFYYRVGVFGPAMALSMHHVFSQSLLVCLLALTPCDRAFCLRPGTGPVSLWSQDLLRLQLSVLYLGAVYEKSYAAWLDGTRMEQVLHAIYLGSDATELGWMSVGLVGVAVFTWAAELFLAVAVWFPRWTPVTLGVAFLLHAGIYWLTPVGTFSVTMFVFLLAIVPPALFGRVWRSATVDLPLAPLALVPLLGLVGFGPPVRGFDGLALQACDVQLGVDGTPVRVPERVLSGGRDGLQATVARLCRRRGPVDVRGRCASSDGWASVDVDGWCPEPVPEPAGRRSAW